jgi:fucose permease
LIQVSGQLMGVTLMPRDLRPANKIALVAIGGILASLLMWFRYGVVGVAAVLFTTLVIDVVYAARLDAQMTLELDRARGTGDV